MVANPPAPVPSFPRPPRHSRVGGNPDWTPVNCHKGEEGVD